MYRKSIFLFIIVMLLISLSCVTVMFLASSVYADSFTSVGVFSDVREYDQNDFSGQGRIARMMVYADATGDVVTVDSTPTGNGKTLGWDSGNNLWVRTFDSPSIGSAWQTTYIFHSGSSTFSLDISGCTIQELSVPNVTISADGRTISWDPVNNATYYSIYWYPLKDGLPDESGGPLVQTGRIYDTSFTLSNPIPGTYALRLNAHEICSGAIVNRSTLYKKHTIPDLEHFVFSTISSQTVDTPFNVTITALDANGNRVWGFNSSASLTSNLGAVSPTSVTLVSGQATVSITLHKPGNSTRLNCSAYGAYGNSNYFTVIGGSSCSGKIDGNVIDGKENAVSQANVYLYDAQGQNVKSKQTDSEGDFTFESVQCGKYEIRIEKGSEWTTGVDVSVAGNLYNTVFDILLPLDCGAKDTPVILVPAIMGSSNWFWGYTPRLPKVEPASASDLYIHCEWLTGFQTLKEELKDLGFCVFECPWDWRMESDAAYKKYLIVKINEALKKSTTGKVHVVAHSMGGLLVRAYIQSKGYRGDIDKLAMVGTPHLGSSNPYYIWEGGDPKTVDDIVDGKWGGSVLNIYTNTLQELWEDTYEDTYGKKGWSTKNHDEIRAFVRDKVKSLLELMSTESFLTDQSSEWGVGTSGNVNTWLKDLNTGSGGYNAPAAVMSTDGSNGTKVEVMLFVGAKYSSTIKQVKTQKKGSSNATNMLYEDGVPMQGKPKESNVIWDFGDGTVPYESAVLPYKDRWASLNSKASTDEKHSFLVKDFIGEIKAFLTPATAGQAVDKPMNAAESTAAELSVSIVGDMRVAVTDPQSRQTGIDPDTGNPVKLIPDSKFSFGTEGGGVGIEDPAGGSYQVTFFGEGQRDFYLNIGYMEEDATETQRFRGFCPDTPRTFTVAVAPSGTPRISVTPPAIAPTGLKADPYASGATEYARLTWNVAGETGVTGYNVYSVAELKPYFSKVASVAAGTTSYDSNDKWSSESSTQVMSYAVTAVKSDDTESFFSKLVQNNDRDHDGLSDQEETELGTDPNKADTDGDGLNDGDEQSYGTNPLVKDTDKDTYSDYVEIEAGSDPLDPQSVPAPRANIQANGSDGPVVVSQGESVSIEISLDPSNRDGELADWWIAVNTAFAPPLDWYTYVYPTGWLPGINLCIQTELFDLSPFEVLNMTLPVGNYTFYFAIDDPDGGATGPWWALDSVAVTVQ